MSCHSRVPPWGEPDESGLQPPPPRGGRPSPFTLPVCGMFFLLFVIIFVFVILLLLHLLLLLLLLSWSNIYLSPSLCLGCWLSFIYCKKFRSIGDVVVIVNRGVFNLITSLEVTYS